jgi:hypothetical protein
MKIITDRPIPAPITGRPPIYPFAQLQPGQSFDTPINFGETPKTAAARVRSAAASWRARNARDRISFVVRAGDGCVSVWAR